MLHSDAPPVYTHQVQMIPHQGVRPSNTKLHLLGLKPPFRRNSILYLQLSVRKIFLSFSAAEIAIVG